MEDDIGCKYDLKVCRIDFWVFRGILEVTSEEISSVALLSPACFLLLFIYLYSVITIWLLWFSYWRCGWVSGLMEKKANSAFPEGAGIVAQAEIGKSSKVWFITQADK